MTAQESDEIMFAAIIKAVEQCKAGKITTTELVDKVEEIIDCGRALDQHRENKESRKL